MSKMYIAKYHSPGTRMLYMDTDSIIFTGTITQVAKALESFGIGNRLG